MKTKPQTHYITFTDGSKAKVRGKNKQGKIMRTGDAVEYAEWVYGKKVEKVETW